MRFSTVDGRSLEGTSLILPRDLPAELTLALIAFQQSHQSCVDRWIAQAEAAGIPGSPRDMNDADERCVVEIPVLSTRWRLGRSFIDGGMAANIKVPRVLARTITVYTDVRAFQMPLGIQDSAEVNACVVRRTGEVLVRVSGEPTPSNWAVIAEAMGVA